MLAYARLMLTIYELYERDVDKVISIFLLTGTYLKYVGPFLPLKFLELIATTLVLGCSQVYVCYVSACHLEIHFFRSHRCAISFQGLKLCGFECHQFILRLCF